MKRNARGAVRDGDETNERRSFGRNVRFGKACSLFSLSSPLIAPGVHGGLLPTLDVYPLEFAKCPLRANPISNPRSSERGMSKEHAKP